MHKSAPSRRSLRKLPLAGIVRKYGSKNAKYICPAVLEEQTEELLFRAMRTANPPIPEKALKGLRAPLENENRPLDLASVLRRAQFLINLKLRAQQIEQYHFLLAHRGRLYQLWQVEWT